MENSDDNDKETKPQHHGIAKTSGSETDLWMELESHIQNQA